VRLAKMISVMVDVYDRSGLLHEITQLMQDQDINIAHICTLRDVQPGMQKIELQLEMISPRQLVGILHQIEALVNVQRVRRIPDLQGSGRPADESYKPARTSHPFE
jgi:(p)ppGpp synthase/HD superfamily hydrolase